MESSIEDRLSEEKDQDKRHRASEKKERVSHFGGDGGGRKFAKKKERKERRTLIDGNMTPLQARLLPPFPLPKPP